MRTSQTRPPLIRTRNVYILGPLLCTIGVIWLLGMVLASGRSLWDVGVLIVLAMTVIWTPIGWRTTRMGVRPVAAGVEVVNFSGRTTVPWTSIDRFELHRAEHAGIVAAAVLHDGSRVDCNGIQAPWMRTVAYTRRTSEAQQRVEELNDLLRQHQGARG